MVQALLSCYSRTEVGGIAWSKDWKNVGDEECVDEQQDDEVIGSWQFITN